MIRPNRAQTAAALRDIDPVLANLVDRHGLPPSRRPVPSTQRFAALARAIVYQQLAGKAASAIHGRFVLAVGGTVTADSVLATPTDALAASGLSAAKTAAVRDLAEKVVAGQVALERLGRLPDEAVVDHLVQVRGIGRWTAEMFLLGVLGRPDIWPTGDYGVRAGFAAAWGLSAIPSATELALLGDPYRPYRSAVAWYCWRAVEG